MIFGVLPIAESRYCALSGVGKCDMPPFRYARDRYCPYMVIDIAVWVDGLRIHPNRFPNLAKNQ
jgi:hypothetical protein